MCCRQSMLDELMNYITTLIQRVHGGDVSARDIGFEYLDAQLSADYALDAHHAQKKGRSTITNNGVCPQVTGRPPTWLQRSMIELDSTKHLLLIKKVADDLKRRPGEESDSRNQNIVGKLLLRKRVLGNLLSALMMGSPFDVYDTRFDAVQVGTLAA